MYLRKFFVLRKVANVEKLTVSQEEVDAQIKGLSHWFSAI